MSTLASCVLQQPSITHSSCCGIRRWCYAHRRVQGLSCRYLESGRQHSALVSVRVCVNTMCCMQYLCL